MDSTTSSPQTPLLNEGQTIDQAKVDALSAINSLFEDFLSHEFEDFYDGKDKSRVISNGEISITIDLSKLKR